MAYDKQSGWFDITAAYCSRQGGQCACNNLLVSCCTLLNQCSWEISIGTVPDHLTAQCFKTGQAHVDNHCLARLAKRGPVKVELTIF